MANTPDPEAVQALAPRAYYVLCRALGRLLRSTRYSTARSVGDGVDRVVHKRRVVYAPLLVWMGGLLLRLLASGVRILPQRDWEVREADLYERLFAASIRVDPGGVLVLPCLAGVTLANVLQDPAWDDSARTWAIERAVAALVQLHRLGLTHADAMADNVLVDVDAGVARWVDFETVHDSSRAVAWRRADDVRALLVTCLVRTDPARRAEILRLILDEYGDPAITGLLAASFTSIWQRPLSFHLAQAGLSFASHREIGRLLTLRGART